MRNAVIMLVLIGCVAAGCAKTASRSHVSSHESIAEHPDQSNGAQVARLIDDLRSRDDKVRRKAINTLARLGPAAKPAVPALTEILKDRHAPFRPAVAISFNQILPPHVDLFKLFPDLRYVGDMLPVDLRSADRRQKLAKAEEIANDEAANAIAVALPALVGALTDGDAYVRQYAALSLGACGPLARDSVPALIRALEDKNEGVRMRSGDTNMSR